MPSDPLWLPSISYDETELRRMDSALVMADGTALGSRPGTRPGDPGLAVSLAGTTVNVTGGAATLHRSGQGVYRAQLAASSPGALAAANGTYTRIDLVYLRVWDTAVDSSGLRRADTVLLTGTPSASPAAPVPGATEIYIPLATITVPNTAGGGTGSATVSATVRQVTVAPGGILPVSSAADIAISGVHVGQARYNSVRGVPEYWNGTAWRAQGDYTAYTPAWTASTTNPVLNNGTLAARWARIGGQINCRGTLQLGSLSNGGTGTWFLSLPVAAASVGIYEIGSCDYTVLASNNFLGAVEIDPGGVLMVFPVKTGSTASSTANVSNTLPVGASSATRLSWNITYEPVS
ncbi:hypothetical protein F4556_002354 [Kitasatospora gansuensis]|uniref:Uncharacterized protein n=1 Tax=Kitasatospora gansuensis TaxID=258050 RepID=A0A7W7SAB9_9ACTN|nr:hypothetical protein [Kitasatospora gansuensis]MBB4946819.1 hypothetical protein [Kitasatospora gansuensis]